MTTACFIIGRQNYKGLFYTRISNKRTYFLKAMGKNSYICETNCFLNFTLFFNI